MKVSQSSGSTGDARLPTGVPGLDEILQGGFIPRRSYLLWGGPGTGKTTLGLHFLRESADPGKVLFVCLGETAQQLRDNAARIGQPLDGIEILDLSPVNRTAPDDETYSLLESWEVEGNTIHSEIVEHVQRQRPSRIVVDSLSQLRFLGPDAFQFRKQVLSTLSHLTDTGATVVFTAEMDAAGSDDDLRFLSDGVIQLEMMAGGFRLNVTKFRGSGFIAGAHSYTLTDAGAVVYPRLVPGDHARPHVQESLSSGVPKLDQVLGGGIERGTVTIVSGPTGVGKTTLGSFFASAAVSRGERCAIYSFDESGQTFLGRCRQLGLAIEEGLENKNLTFEAVEPLIYDSDQFAVAVRREVEHHGARFVILDSLSGYRRALRGSDLTERVHALCRYLANMGVAVVLVNEVTSIAGGPLQATEHGISYLADTVVILRYVEHEGALTKALGVLKKRTGDFEKSFRRFELTSGGVEIGGTMNAFTSLLRDMPEQSYVNGDGP